MSGGPYAIGVDFGTESGRALLLDVSTGAELSVGVVRYPHGVIDRELPDGGGRVGADWALQDPDDWVTVLVQAIAYVVADGGIEPGTVAGLGIDFTSCTVLPVDARGDPVVHVPATGGRGRTHGQSCGSITRRSRSPIG